MTEDLPPVEEREEPRETVTVEIDMDAMPSLDAQMDESGKGSTDIRHQIATASRGDERIGEVLVGFSGSLWFESEAGPRVQMDATEFAKAAVEAIERSEFEAETDE